MRIYGYRVVQLANQIVYTEVSIRFLLATTPDLHSYVMVVTIPRNGRERNAWFREIPTYFTERFKNNTRHLSTLEWVF